MEVISLKRGLTAHAAGMVVVGDILYAVGLRLGDGVRGGVFMWFLTCIRVA